MNSNQSGQFHPRKPFQPLLMWIAFKWYGQGFVEGGKRQI